MAILLVVLYHVNSHLGLPHNTFWRAFHVPFDFLRMPLFTVISGFVYSLRPAQEGALFLFWKKKARRLLLPWLSWSTISYLVFAGLFDQISSRDYIYSLVFPFHQYWFLQVMAFLFVIVAICEVLGVFSHKTNWLLSFIGSFIGYLVFRYVLPAASVIPDHFPTYFSFNGIFHLLPFFLIGIGIQRFFYQKTANGTVLLLGVVTGMGCLIGFLDLADLAFGEWASKDGFLYMILGCCGTGFILSLYFQNKWLAYLGSKAYPIYLIHVLVLVLVKNSLYSLGIYAPEIAFPVIFLATLTLPILIEKWIKKNNFLKFICFGLKKKTAGRAVAAVPSAQIAYNNER